MYLNDVIQIYRPTGIFLVTESTGTRNNIRTSASAGVDGRHWVVAGSLSHLIWVEQEPPTGGLYMKSKQINKNKTNEAAPVETAQKRRGGIQIMALETAANGVPFLLRHKKENDKETSGVNGCAICLPNNFTKRNETKRIETTWSQRGKGGRGGRNAPNLPMGTNTTLERP